MKLPARLQRRLHWLNLPGALLVLLLQRMPVLSALVAADEIVVISPAGSAVLKSLAATAAALGAVNSMAGATPLSPSSGTETDLAVTAGAAVNVFYTVTGTATPPLSWTVSGQIPPGLNFSGLAAPGTINVGTLNLRGTPTTAGTYTLTLRAFEFANATGIESPVYNYTITVTGNTPPPPPPADAAPVITTQPASKLATGGSSVTFAVVASGSPAPAFRWRKNGAHIPGAAGSEAFLTLDPIDANSAGTYTVVVTNSAGSVISQEANLTVRKGHLLNATATTGHTATFSAENTSGSIQWQVSTNGGATWANLANGGNYSGVKTYSLTVTDASPALNGLQYRFVANDHGTISISSAATLTVAPALLPFPTSIAIDSSGNLLVGDSNTNTLQKITPSGEISLLAGASGAAGSVDGQRDAARFNQPGGITVLSPNLPNNNFKGHAIVTDTGNATLRDTVVLANGNLLVTTLAGSSTTRGSADGLGGAASFSSPAGIGHDANGALYVADAMNNIIRKVVLSDVSLDQSATVSTLAGTAGVSGSTDGNGPAARFNFPSGLVVDGNGNIYVADTTNNTIRKITANGAVTTLAGLPGVSGFEDGAGVHALFNRPTGLAADPNGNIYVADTGNSTIRRITPDGVVTTLAGLPTIAGLEDGFAFALFNHPQALCVSPDGSIFVADTGNAAIRRIEPIGMVSTLVLTQAAAPAPAPSPSPAPAPAPAPSPAPAPAPSGSGGGGAPSPWFLVALSVLFLTRLKFRQRR